MSDTAEMMAALEAERVHLVEMCDGERYDLLVGFGAALRVVKEHVSPSRSGRMERAGEGSNLLTGSAPLPEVAESEMP